MRIETEGLTFASQSQVRSSGTHIMDLLLLVNHVLKVRHSLKVLIIAKMLWENCMYSNETFCV
jgi:hypothetical protein